MEQNNGQITGITVSPPNQLEYYTDSEFNASGMIVKAVLSDGSEIEVADYQISGFDSGSVGNRTITVAYREFTAEFEVVILARDGLRVLFLDSDQNTVLKEQYVQPGESASAPVPPAHRGLYFFAWSVSFSCIEEDTAIHAIYRPIRNYTSAVIYDIELKVGEIRKVTDAQISQKLNGECTFELSTLTSLADFVRSGYRVEMNGLVFNITEVEKSIQNGVCITTIKGEHISYILIQEQYKIEKFSYTGSPTRCLARLLSGTPFSIGTVDFDDTVSLKINQTATRREAVMQLTAICGGEIEYNNYTIGIRRHIGNENVVRLMDKENVSDIGVSVDARNGTESYSISLFKKIQISLGDEIQIVFRPFDIDVRKRIAEITCNPFNSRSVSITVGDYKATISDTLYKASSGNTDELEDRINDLAAAYSNGCYTTAVVFNSSGFDLSFSNGNGTDGTNTFIVNSDDDGNITEIQNVTAGRSITVKYDG